jgi:hypothetical protein
MGTKTEAELWAKLVADAEDRADAELSEEAIDAELRAAGADPVALGRRGAKIAATAQAGASARPVPALRANGAAKPAHSMSSPLHGSGTKVDSPPPPPFKKKP